MIPQSVPRPHGLGPRPAVLTGCRHHPVVVRQPRVALLLVMIREQAMGRGVVRRGAEDHGGPVEGLGLVAVFEHPPGHLEPRIHVARLPEQGIAELIDPLVVLAQAAGPLALGPEPGIVADEPEGLGEGVANVGVERLDLGQELPAGCRRPDTGPGGGRSGPAP